MRIQQVRKTGIFSLFHQAAFKKSLTNHNTLGAFLAMGVSGRYSSLWLKNKSFRYVTFVALSSQKHQNIPPVTALLMHPPGPSHCTMYCDVRLGSHSALALRQDEPLLSQSQGLRVCSSSCDPFGRPSSLYCTVQTMHYTLQPHTRGALLSITGSFIQLFKQNSRTERKVSHHCGVAMSQRIMLDLKQVMSISSSWSLWFLSLS